MKTQNPFRYFKTSTEIIRLAVMVYVRFPLSLRNVEDFLHERGIDVSHETVRYWWNWVDYSLKTVQNSRFRSHRIRCCDITDFVVNIHEFNFLGGR